MVIAGRRRSIVYSIGLGAGLIAVILLLYIGWVLLNWRTGILLFFGILLVTVIITGVVLNTTFLVREMRRNEQHDAFINAVTHELKTPVASIRLYLETLQTRTVDESKRQEFYRTMVEDSDRLLATIEQVLRTGTGRLRDASQAESRAARSERRGGRMPHQGAHAAPRLAGIDRVSSRASGHGLGGSGRGSRGGV